MRRCAMALCVIAAFQIVPGCDDPVQHQQGAEMLDLEKRNAIIRRYHPELFVPENEEPVEIRIPEAVSRVSYEEGLDLSPLFREPEKYRGWSDAAILDELRRIRDNLPPKPTLSIEEFFDGNTDEYSIAPNRTDLQPPLAVFRTTLEAIAARPDVQTIRLSVHEMPHPLYEEDDDMWIHVGNVLVWTSMDATELNRLFEPLRSDGCGPSLLGDVEGPEPAPGMTIYMATWD